jgi:hypothetical protein
MPCCFNLLKMAWINAWAPVMGVDYDAARDCVVLASVWVPYRTCSTFPASSSRLLYQVIPLRHYSVPAPQRLMVTHSLPGGPCPS